MPAFSRIACRAPSISKRDLREIFRSLDADGSGAIAAQEYYALFEVLGGQLPVADDGDQRLTFPEFVKTVEYYAFRYPSLQLSERLQSHLQQMRAEREPEEEESGISFGDLTETYGILDVDGTGSLDFQELRRLMHVLGCYMQWQAFDDGDGEIAMPEFIEMVQAYDQAFPQLDVNEKLQTFLASQPTDGSPPSQDDPEPEPEPEAPEEPASRKALLVGINYIGQSSELGGCINDVRNQMACLIEHFGYAEEDILLLTEDQDDDSKLPTAANMRAGFEWLMEGAEPNDRRFFHYSGHGSQMPDSTGEEPDGKNEVLCPLDLDWGDNMILDNELVKVFFEDVPDGVWVTCVYDCCHSATMADLVVTRSLAQPSEGDQDFAPRYLEPPPEIQEAIQAAPPADRGLPGERSVGLEGKEVVTFSGCQDNQTSADATIEGQRQGALSYSLFSAISSSGFNITNEGLLAASRRILKGKYTQVPAMSSTKEVHFKHAYLGGGQ